MTSLPTRCAGRVRVEPRVLAVQFQNVKPNDMEQFRDPKTEVILWPPELKTGEIQYPYSDVKR